MLEPGRGDGGTVFVQGGGSRDAERPAHGSRRSCSRWSTTTGSPASSREKLPVTLELDVANRFHDADLTAFNVVGELPGTDKSDELVMLGAHFDSWHAGTGATDNAAGSAVMMEAMRILKATGLSLRRTVRIGLWTGEEQGLLGSRAYVTDHFADRQTMALRQHTRSSRRTSTWTTARGRSAASTCRATRLSRRSSGHGWSRFTTSG